MRKEPTGRHIRGNCIYITRRIRDIARRIWCIALQDTIPTTVLFSERQPRTMWNGGDPPYAGEPNKKALEGGTPRRRSKKAKSQIHGGDLLGWSAVNGQLVRTTEACKQNQPGELDQTPGLPNYGHRSSPDRSTRGGKEHDSIRKLALRRMEAVASEAIEQVELLESFATTHTRRQREIVSDMQTTYEDMIEPLLRDVERHKDKEERLAKDLQTTRDREQKSEASIKALRDGREGRERAAVSRAKAAERKATNYEATLKEIEGTLKTRNEEAELMKKELVDKGNHIKGMERREETAHQWIKEQTPVLRKQKEEIRVKAATIIQREREILTLERAVREEAAVRLRAQGTIAQLEETIDDLLQQIANLIPEQ